MAGCCSCAPKASCPAPDRSGEWIRMAFAGLVAAQSMIFGLAINLSPPVGPARWILHTALALSAIVVFLLTGKLLWERAWQGIRQGKVVMEQLFLAGILGAFAASVHASLTGVGHVYYEVVAILLAIYTFGTLLTERRRNAALEAAQALWDEFDACEKVLADGSTERVSVQSIQPGDRIFVPAGGAIPVDGKIIQGTSQIRETALTGEPLPVTRRAGDRVLAGSHSVDGTLTIACESAAGLRKLDVLLDAVKNARQQPSRLQSEADRLVAWFLPIVLMISALTFVFWTWRAGWMVGVFNSLAVLVVACPCSMGLATPIGLWGAISALARRGLVARNPDLIEKLARIDTVVFDKTGTLAEQELELVDFVTSPQWSREVVLQAAAAVESGSDHPIARCFRSKAGGLEADQFATLPGVGVSARILWHGKYHTVAVGNAHLVGDTGSVSELRSNLRGVDAASHEVYVAWDDQIIGVGLLRERLRDAALLTLHRLENLGIACLVMTGDRAEAVAVHGLPNVAAGLTPAEKAERVRQLTAEGKQVLFIGDGVNDAPAMTEAKASLAISEGTTLAKETADGELFGGNLQAVEDAILRSRQTIAAIRRNLSIAGIYNFIGIGMAAAGIIHPVVAALLMLCSSFTVTTLALRNAEQDTIKVKPSRKPILPNPVALPWMAWVGGLALASQGFFLVYLGDFHGWTAVGFILLFLFAAGVCFRWLSRRQTEPSQMALEMFSLGGMAMLIGWWLDVGLAPVIREGVCLCACPDSTFGFGLVGKLNWMSAGMVVASLPAWFISPIPKLSQRAGCWLLGLVGMFVGMEAGAILMGLIPVIPTHAHAHFFANYAVMILGMTTGMLVACQAWRRLQPSATP